MQLSTLAPVQLRRVRAPTIWIVAGGLAFAGLASMVSGMVSGAFAAPPAVASLAVAGTIHETWSGFAEWVSASYARAPALVLGLVALITVPPLALIGWLARRREAETGDDVHMRTQVKRVARRPAAEPREGVRTGHIPLRPLEAWVEVVNRHEVAPSASDQRYSLARTLLRIGRETDNDICLEDKTVHRYHAAIHRTEDAEFVITDLSSVGGNGVVVNGRAVAEARLASGDMIELGNARLKFSAAPPSR